MKTMDSILNEANELYIQQIKEKLFENIYNKLLEDFKKDAEPIVKEEVDRLVNMHIEHWGELSNIGNNIKVIMEWKNE
jgi:hypothetical protein